ncbi:1-deoxy-D-xylulose-5-phosphate synthase, partial [Escherichia coli]|nr:1-deoxy-D-xylulose-5-phosphate synthase [Escherichia coli]
MRSASGNGFDSSDSFAVSGAAERTARLHDIPPSITPSHGDDSHLLSRIASPADVKALAPNELAELCREIRTTLLAYGHQHGGHIGSNLGMVEATVALHRVFDSPRDRIVFDVSHQS